MKSKKNGEVAHIYISGVLEDIKRRDEERNNLDAKLEDAFKKLIMQTTKELMGEGQIIEKKLKKSLGQ